MSKRLIAAVVLFTAFSPALAQMENDAKALKKAPPQPKADVDDSEGAADEGQDASGPSEIEGQEVLESGNQVKTAPPGQARTAAPGEVHTVEKGDTLWDLSQRFLGSPWYWPKVWSYNPEIANPHWIYPGNLVRFFPGGEESPTQVVVGEGPPVAEDVAPSAPIEDNDFAVAGPIGYQGKSQTRIPQVGFVTSKELDEAGKIDSSFAETTMLSFPQSCYVTFKNKSNAKVGDRYVIFHTVSEVKHPNGGRWGFMTKFLGTVKILTVSDKLVTAQIQDDWDEIVRGDLIGPYGENLSKQVAARPNEKELKGFVIGILEPKLTLAGENHYVIIDKGSGDGVQLGNTFVVTRQHDKESRESFRDPTKADDRYPIEKIATCMAVDVKDKATTCLMTRSVQEVQWGDKVEMRPGGAGAPRASLR
jgi:hypothetical protein